MLLGRYDWPDVLSTAAAPCQSLEELVMLHASKLRLLALSLGAVIVSAHTVAAQQSAPQDDVPSIEERLEGGPEDGNGTPNKERSLEIEPMVSGPEAMTNDRLGTLIDKIGNDVRFNDRNIWEFSVVDVPVRVITDEKADRMRIVVAVDTASNLTPSLMERLMQANFDSALDARYAVAQGVVWATYIHPLSALNDRQFISGVGQTVNLARNFGTTFSSGALLFGGGDSQDLIARELIDDLLKKGGQEI